MRDVLWSCQFSSNKYINEILMKFLIFKGFLAKFRILTVFPPFFKFDRFSRQISNFKFFPPFFIFNRFSNQVSYFWYKIIFTTDKQHLTKINNFERSNYETPKMIYHKISSPCRLMLWLKKVINFYYLPCSDTFMICFIWALSDLKL